MFPNNTSDITSSLLQEILMASKQQINHLHQICAFLQYFAAFCSILQHEEWKTMMVLPRNTPDISTYCHQVILLSKLLKIYHMLTLSAFLQYLLHFAAFHSIFQENLGASMEILKIYIPKIQFQHKNLCQQLLAPLKP